MASTGLNIEEQKAVERFKTDVVEPSMHKLVILDFWAEWCGPCKALTPMLEKVATEYADKGVILVKVNVDEDKFIAGQFQVQSIPTVYAMFQGQPVADLTPARSESQIKQMLDQLLEKLPVPKDSPAKPEQDVGQFIAMAEKVLAEGDAERAAGVFMQVVQMAPDNAPAHSGLIRALIASSRIEEAQSIADALTDEMRSNAAIAQALSALELSATAVDDGELQALRARFTDTANNTGAGTMDESAMAAGLALAEATYAAGNRDEAAQVLLAMVEADRAWNEGAARTKLLQIFEAVGLEDDWVVSTRRRLSKILFS